MTVEPATQLRGVLQAAMRAIGDAAVGDTSRLDAELLVGHVLGLDRVQLRVQDDRLLTPDEVDRLEGLVVRRVAGEPIAYLLGSAWFYGHEFAVDRRVLVPRPETEALVELALAHVDTLDVEHAIVVDACTGSGCVGISVALERPRVEVHCTDISTDALDVARVNAEALGATVQLHTGNLLDPLADVAPVHVVVANPPYVEGADAAGLEPAVRDHEPHVALFVPGEGVAEFYSLLAAGARAVLVPGGLFAVEHGQGQRAMVAGALEAAGFVDVDGRDDLAGIDRIVLGHAPEGAS
ncbi:MAG: Modification methylase HemK [Thermoleophilia bacterium]|nr:Modification methylase HemK [Thermoleophilia bacterium]